jgi:acetyl esterase/lipase
MRGTFPVSPGASLVKPSRLAPIACALTLAWPLAAAAQTARVPAPKPPAVVIPPGHPAIALWPGGAPGSEARKGEPERIDGETVLNVHNPSIIAFLPAKAVATGAAIVMAPGGGHQSLWIMHEGVNPALALNEKGIAVFVLKNRLQSSGYTFDVEGLADMQRAIRTVRSRAAEWGVDPARIGAAGFSAGGELAALAALRNDAGKPDAADPIERVSSRPDFQVLVYPGKSHLIQPVAGSPPAFLAAGFDDRPDISSGLAEAYLRFRKVGVQAELHMYANVGHGFGVRPERAGQSQQEWTTQLVAFLHQAKLIGAPAP